jgi:hypothetical protein
MKISSNLLMFLLLLRLILATIISLKVGVRSSVLSSYRPECCYGYGIDEAIASINNKIALKVQQILGEPSSSITTIIVAHGANVEGFTGADY